MESGIQADILCAEPSMNFQMRLKTSLAFFVM